MMGDLYSRVYHLPHRLQTARHRLARLERQLRDAKGDRAATLSARIDQVRLRERALETEAERFGFTDLIERREVTV